MVTSSNVSCGMVTPLNHSPAGRGWFAAANEGQQPRPASRCSLFLLCLLCAALFLAGCGNASLRGDAMTAAQESTMDAYQAVLRSGDPATQPATGTIKSYLVENFKQWRSFVRSAKADLTWGPKLAGE